jgi:hypothetical protein
LTAAQQQQVLTRKGKMMPRTKDGAHITRLGRDNRARLPKTILLAANFKPNDLISVQLGKDMGNGKKQIIIRKWYGKLKETSMSAGKTMPRQQQRRILQQQQQHSKAKPMPTTTVVTPTTIEGMPATASSCT